jgi:dihydroxy-acid dehydratase
MHRVLKHACPTAGACGGMYTANTMASAIETLGHEPAVQFFHPGQHGRREKSVSGRQGDPPAARKRYQAARYHHQTSLENAVAMIIALGGSTNAVMHMLAIARACGGRFYDRRFPGGERPHPVPGRPETERKVCDGRSLQCGRGSCRAEAAA